MTDTILLVRATDMFGSRIADRLLMHTDAQIRLLIRNVADSRDRLEPMIEAGAEVIESDLADPVSLDWATRGVDVAAKMPVAA